jgi:hypothetical protein
MYKHEQIEINPLKPLNFPNKNYFIQLLKTDNDYNIYVDDAYDTISRVFLPFCFM